MCDDFLHNGKPLCKEPPLLPTELEAQRHIDKNRRQHKKPTNQSVHRGDIFYADLTPVVGSEQGGIRPVLVVQNDTGNKHSPTVIVAPITSQPSKRMLPTHVELYLYNTPDEAPSIALMEQIRTIDKRRLKRFVEQANAETMGKVDQALLVSLNLQQA